MANRHENKATRGGGGVGPSVGIIGCGPSGMFFLHALSLKRKMLEEANDLEGLAKLPSLVTCFERSSNPGGLWRVSNTNSNSNSNSNIANDSTDGNEKKKDDGSLSTQEETFCLEDSDDEIFREFQQEISYCPSMTKTATNMYEALWTNGPKEQIEFFDYTFQEHFKDSHRGADLPVYMPREAILEYIMARVQRNNTDIFKNVQFETTVQSVKYNEETSKFEISIENNDRVQSVQYFDKCIWAAGENGKPSIPRAIMSSLRSGGFQGDIVHSSAIGSLLCKVKGKKLVMFGDAYSAEDLALSAIKQGAEKIYIISRCGHGLCNDVGAWPGNKVEIIKGYGLAKVTQDGHGLRFKQAKMNYMEYKQKIMKKGKIMDLEDIEGVVFCTGYEQNYTMLEPCLKQPFTNYEQTSYQGFPSNWQMNPNALTKDTGNVKPCQWLDSKSAGIIPGMYDGLLMDNPNMMFLTESTEMPLFGIDVNAWVLLGYITGDIEIPSEEEMIRTNEEVVKEAMQYPCLRNEIDLKYTEVLSKKKMHISYDMVIDEMKFNLLRMSHYMRLASYPFDIGSPANGLNDNGEKYLQYLIRDDTNRRELGQGHEDMSKKTFRDSDPSKFESVHTGVVACPLPKMWMDLDDDSF